MVVRDADGAEIMRLKSALEDSVVQRGGLSSRAEAAEQAMQHLLDTHDSAPSPLLAFPSQKFTDWTIDLI